MDISPCSSPRKEITKASRRFPEDAQEVGVLAPFSELAVPPPIGELVEVCPGTAEAPGSMSIGCIEVFSPHPQPELPSTQGRAPCISVKARDPSDFPLQPSTTRNVGGWDLAFVPMIFGVIGWESGICANLGGALMSVQSNRTPAIAQQRFLLSFPSLPVASPLPVSPVLPSS